MNTTLAIPLNDKQVDLLRQLYRESRPVSTENLDGRVVRALRSRALVDESDDGWLTLTDAGRAEFERLRRRRVSAPTADITNSRAWRAEAINRAVDALELALPRTAAVTVGDMHADYDAVVQGLRVFARQLVRAG